MIRSWLLNLAIVVAAGLVVLGFALHDTQQREIERQERIALINQANLAFCKEIELLKTGERRRALDSWKNLRTTLRLLHLKPTQEIRDVAQDNLDTALRRYEPDSCPRVKPLAP